MKEQLRNVIIIGAGTGGLCLAHGLLNAGIQVDVYERDRTRTDGLQGYRVGIDSDGTRALQDNLDPKLFDTFLTTCARPPKYFSMLTEQLSEVLCLNDLSVTERRDPIHSDKSVNRMTLRQVLLTGLEENVHFDKIFTHYQQNDDGSVRAYFDDGTDVTGSLLVAADGTNSRVRQQYLPQAKLADSGLIGITGKVELTPETKALLPPKAFEGVSMVFAPKGYSCILHVMEFKWGHDGEPKDGIGRSDADLLSRWPGMLYDNTRDYIMFGFAAARQNFPRDPMSLRGDELIKLVEQMTRDWHPNLRKLFHLADPSTSFPLNIRTSVPIGPWRRALMQ